MSRALPAVFMRGGTSRAILFHDRDLPAAQADRDALFLAAMGSPDPYGRQLDGMGGGVSSLSKVCVVAPSARPDADVDYTFAQVLIRDARVEHRGNCGNMSEAIGPFAVDEGLVAAHAPDTTVRIFNTNTRRFIRATFPTQGGRAEHAGDCAIPGVASTGAAIRLDFLDPGGATTGRLLPCGAPSVKLDVPGVGRIDASVVDAANAVVFVRARDVGLTGTELPDELEADPAALGRLEAVRVAASLAMGLTRTEAEARTVGLPLVGFISPSAGGPTLTGQPLAARDADLTVRIMSSGNLHRALPLTGALCTAVAAGIEGTLVAEAASAPARSGQTLRLGMPSGVLEVGAQVERTADGWFARSGAFIRTARRLFDGRVWIP